MVALILPLVLQSPFTYTNGKVTLTVDRGTGSFDLDFAGASIKSASGEVRFQDGRVVRTTDSSPHIVSRQSVHDKFGKGVLIRVQHGALTQSLWVYSGRAEVFTQLSATSKVASNYIAPIVSTSVSLRHKDPLQSLYVPYDNDAYVRYRSDAWKEPEGSYEVGALYDDGSRNGLVVGSIDHDTWKSAVQFIPDESRLKAFCGATGKQTRDHEPHGILPGPVVKSARFSIGFYKDWRNGMERFGDLNAIVKPALPWTEPAPFGWNSWSGHKNKLKDSDARVATDFIKDDLPEYRNGGVAYINLDSFWDNLTLDQRVAFVKRVHAKGLKAGIYYTPYVIWGELKDRIDKTQDHYSDIVLRDSKGEPLPRLDGGYPIDPTHPLAVARIDRMLNEFIRLGFDFVKFDFMTHAALEGKHHDPEVLTGTQAYIAGVKHIDAKLAKSKMFISLSIAPLFPHGYAHSRRFSCDAFANIGSSEYLLNSATYCWWEHNRLYRFNDADSACVYQPLGEPPVTLSESRTRFTASVIGGGMLVEGDDLTKPEARERVKAIFSKKALLDLARKSIAFRPVEGATGDKAGSLFYHVDGSVVYLAAFNYDKEQSVNRDVLLSRMGLQGKWTATDLWSGSRAPVGDRVSFKLSAMDCGLVKLTKGR